MYSYRLGQNGGIRAITRERAAQLIGEEPLSRIERELAASPYPTDDFTCWAQRVRICYTQTFETEQNQVSAWLGYYSELEMRQSDALIDAYQDQDNEACKSIRAAMAETRNHIVRLRERWNALTTD